MRSKLVRFLLVENPYKGSSKIPRRTSQLLSSFRWGGEAYSTCSPRNPSRGRSTTTDEQSEDHFLRNLKFGESSVDLRPESAEVGGEDEKEEEKEEESEKPDTDEIFKKMKETGLIPNAVAMLDGLCKDGLVQEAMKLFGAMREKGTIPDVVIYTAVVEAFCKAARYDDAKKIFRKMVDNGIVPNAFSYQVLVQGLYKGKKLEDSVGFCIEMVEAGHSPNVVTFTGLVNAICREKGGVEWAEKAIRRLRESGFLLDEKAVRDHLDKKGPFSPMVQRAIFGAKGVKDKF